MSDPEQWMNVAINSEHFAGGRAPLAAGADLGGGGGGVSKRSFDQRKICTTVQLILFMQSVQIEVQFKTLGQFSISSEHSIIGQARKLTAFLRTNLDRLGW